MTDRERWIVLNLVPNLQPSQLRRLREAFGTLERLWQASPEELARVAGPATGRRVVAACRAADIEEERRRVERAGIRLVTLADAGYPARLRELPDPPPVLYVRGHADFGRPAVAVVGTRRASAYGLAAAERLGYELALRGITVVSGLARGIDAAAHRGALKAGGPTVAVLGSGFEWLYPTEHQSLAEDISRAGAVLSEYPMATRPFPANFPRRNRIISGLSLGVVVVEAADRSGALITADCALEQGREVFAVPGPITSATARGPHRLLQEGAKLVNGVDDIVDELGLRVDVRAACPGEGEAVEGREGQVLACLKDRTPRHVDAITSANGLTPPEVASALLQLELARRVRRLPGQQFVRVADARDRER